MWIITTFTGSSPVRRPSAAIPGENSYKPHMLWNRSSLASSLSQTVQAMLIQSRIARSKSRNIRTSSVPSVKAHYKLNRAFKVIQGHLYSCRQESKTVCCRNVPLMPTLVLKLANIWEREDGKFVDFNDPTQFQETPWNVYKWFLFTEARVIPTFLPLTAWVYVC